MATAEQPHVLILDGAISWYGPCERCGTKVDQDTSSLHWDRLPGGLHGWTAICKNARLCVERKHGNG